MPPNLSLCFRDPQKVLPATESINNLISCHENIEKAKQLLRKVRFPFCTQNDLQSMAELTDSMYEDMGKPELQEKTKVKERSSSKRISCVVLLFFCLLLINNKKNTELF